LLLAVGALMDGQVMSALASLGTIIAIRAL
jgi:hypothetical protein